LYARSLKCVECGRTYSLNETVYQCKTCGNLLEVEYDLKTVAEKTGPSNLAERKTYSMWRYSELLPVNVDRAVSLGEGFTPLLRAENLSRLIGARDLRLKLEFYSPTGSFKDRGSSVLISKARDLGATAVAIDSSGNAATSIAAYSAKTSLQCYVFTPSYASLAKLVQAGMSGANVFRVEGTRRDAFEIATRACEEWGWYYCGFQTNPFASDGLKTIVFEVCEQLEWKPPDRMIFPVGTGSGIVGCWTGLRMLRKLGWIEGTSSLVCVQPEGCAPIVKAFKHGSEEIEAVDHPRTIAEGLMIGRPLKGKIVLRALQNTKGLATAASDDEIIEAAKLLAKSEGLFVEPSAATAIAGLQRSIKEGTIDSDERIACVLTGTGLKTVETYESRLQPSSAILPSVDELRKVLKKM